MLIIVYFVYPCLYHDYTILWYTSVLHFLIYYLYLYHICILYYMLIPYLELRVCTTVWVESTYGNNTMSIHTKVVTTTDQCRTISSVCKNKSFMKENGKFPQYSYQFCLGFKYKNSNFSVWISRCWTQGSRICTSMSLKWSYQSHRCILYLMPLSMTLFGLKTAMWLIASFQRY